MYQSKNRVRMHDSDMAGIIYFASQFRWVHDAFEDWMREEDLGFHHLFTTHDYAFVIVHCEADFHRPVQVGDPLIVSLEVAKLGTHSFTVHYTIHVENGPLIGRAETVHCTVDAKLREKIALPTELRMKLLKYGSRELLDGP